MSVVLPAADQAVRARREQIVADLRAIVPGEGVISAEYAMRPYESDGLTAYRQLPMVVVLPETTDQVPGLAASSGVVEGTARVVLSPEEFDSVQRDEIVVCRMTSPAWVVLFTRISGLVTDAGGMASHPAVVSREFGIPAVVGTSDATRRIRTGDRVRVNGSLGRVEILA